MTNKDRPTMEKVTVLESYRIRWQDGEIWKVICDVTDNRRYSVFDPQGKALNPSDPMWGTLMDFVVNDTLNRNKQQ
jgi:hypothetical protein